MITYNFEDLQSMSDFFSELGKRARENQAVAKTQREIYGFGNEAYAYEYVVNVIKDSNLINGRIIMVDDDLEEAANEVSRAISQVSSTIDELNKVNRQLKEKLSTLVKVDAS